jgi:hypothetical protein
VRALKFAQRARRNVKAIPKNWHIAEVAQRHAEVVQMSVLKWLNITQHQY